MKYLYACIARVCSALFLVIILNHCNSDHRKKESIELVVTSPWVSDQEVTREYVGQVKAIQHIQLRAFEGGYLQKIFVDEGQYIQEGSKMFEIMPALKRAEYKKAKAEAELVRIEYENTQKLADKKVVSQNELALAKAKYDKALADLELAKTHLDLTTIKAPFNGFMDRFEVRLGSFVDEGELLTTLSDTSTIWVYFNVSESDYLHFMSQMTPDNSPELHLRLADGSIYPHTGKIDTIEADFNNETGNIAFRSSFPNPDRLLRHGETGNILVSLPVKDALLVPQKSTFEILDKKFVYKIDEKNIVRSQPVVVKEELPHLYIISEGLSSKDRILVEGINKVSPGEEIRPKVKQYVAVLEELNVPAE
ncbi:MAG: efflux RND transporter periplasmic adaptor subunit [Deltaproteobacteria bacterium]|nr:efflux RND transporter periplasmic adaptor subunit [Deltaproteobacteria bacterium]